MSTGKDIMERAAIILQDDGFVRWLPSELCSWINEGIKAIILAKPSAKTETRVLTLAKGTLQAIATVSGSPTPLALISLTRNITATTPVRIGGRTVRAVSGALLDAQEPYWHDPNQVRFAKEVRQYVYDEQNPLEFYVYPGNDGTGQIEGVVSVLPTLLAATGAANELASYDTDLTLPEPYSVPLLDYVLYRAFSKDDTGAQPGRSMSHYSAFASALGIKIQVEGASSPNSRRGGS